MLEFYQAEFSGGDVSFEPAEFSGKSVSFRGAKFSGGQVDFSQVAGWTHPPKFGWRYAATRSEAPSPTGRLAV